MDDAIIRRAAVHAALGDPVRLAIIDELTRSDRSPSELGKRFGLPTNLLAHHLANLERVGLIERIVSSGDGRRRYVRLCPAALTDLTPAAHRPRLLGRALFVCTHNSARSQLAAAIWRARTGGPASSAGTHPADRVHPGAVAAARRLDLDLGGAEPRRLDPFELDAADVVVSVCDRAHEEIDLPSSTLHWSIPDPVGSDDPNAFDRAAELIDHRIQSIGASAPNPPQPPATETS